MRPLEYSANCGTLKLMTAILESRDIYRVKDEIVGISIYSWYYITDSMFMFTNSNNSRFFVSLLKIIAKIGEKHVKTKFVKKMFSSGLMSDWMENTCAWNIQGYIIFMFLHIPFFVSLLVYRMNISWLDVI